MKHIWLFLLVILLLTLSFCKQTRFQNEDLINKYLQEKAVAFPKESDFHLLVFQNPPYTCYQARQRIEFEPLIPKLIDSLNIKKLIVISCNKNTVAKFDSLFSQNNKVAVIYEEPDSLYAFGFPVVPHLFKIKKLRVSSWHKLSTEASPCW